MEEKRGVRILVVDDEMVARIKAEVLLNAYGAVTAAEDGPSALRLYAQGLDQGEPYGLVTVDYRMPGMDGPTLVKTLRELEEERGAEPAKVLMITALDDMKSMSTAFWEGCQGYLVKPLTPLSLEQALDRMYLTPLEK